MVNCLSPPIALLVEAGQRLPGVSKLIPFRSDSVLAWAEDSPEAAANVIACVALLITTQDISNSFSGLLAAGQRVANICNHVAQSIDKNYGDWSIEFLLTGIDRMRCPQSLYIKGDTDTGYAAEAIQIPTYPDVFATGSGGAAALERLASFPQDNDMSPFLALMSVIEDHNIHCCGGAPCLARCVSNGAEGRCEVIEYKSNGGKRYVLG